MITPVVYDELTAKQRKEVREQYAKEQNGICYFCKEELKDKPSKNVEDLKINLSLFPKGFLRYPAHLHHSHETGMTIGTVHSKCNAVLFEYYGE